ncbi:hypothetical protein EV426DRAFT_226581 [Tirmania nivea]|nr:hypothetical protein EV426DRAFT_226581 [Tirmania nivea]
MSSKVNRPVDPQVRDRDIENKLRLYGIYNAFANGKVPSNKQIDVALNSFISSKQLKSPNSALSGEGKGLLQDFKDIVEQAKLLLLTKNHGELLQEFIWHAEQLGRAGQAPSGLAGNASLPVSKDTAQEDKQQGLEGLRTLGTLIISNGQFRKLLNDAQILFRDIAGDVAQKAATRVNPTEDELAQIDRPAQENVWHDVPNLSKDNLKEQLRYKVDRNKPVHREDLREASGAATQAANPEDSSDSRDVIDRVAQGQHHRTDSGVDARSGLQAGITHLHDRARENIPDEHQDRANRAWSSTRHYMNSKFNEDRRKQTIWRLKKMVVEIQDHPDYQQAIDTLLRLAENYRGHASTAVVEGRNQISGAHEDDHLQAAENSLKTLIERFANYTSLDDMFDSINDIYRDADKDPELRSWFRQMDSYIRKCLKTPGYILSNGADREWDTLNSDGHFLLRERYRDHTDRVVNETKFIFDQFAQDTESKMLGHSLQKLFNDLGTDENGKPKFKKHLVKDITDVIIPDIFENIRYVPVPRIEYSDPMIDAVIENLIIESDNLMPNLFEISNDSFFRWGRKTVSNINRQSFMVSLSGIQCDLRDVSYYIKKKTGFPSLTDTGVADFFLGGAGLGLKLHLSTPSKHGRAHFFKCDKVDVTISNLSVKLKQSRHKLLFTALKPLLLQVMRPVIQRVAARQIQGYFATMDAFAWRVYQEQEKAKKEVVNDPENAPNVYSRYVTAFKNQMLREKQQAQEVVADKEMKMAVTKEDSLDKFKNISLPGGISTKATEYKNLVWRGDRWQSEVFSIGSAPESRDLPKPREITRKSPHAHRVSVKDHPAPVQGFVTSTPTTYSAVSRASRDSGYHGADSVILNKPGTNTSTLPTQGLAQKLDPPNMGTTANTSWPV